MDALLRRRMMMAGGDITPAPEPPAPAELIYELENPTTAAGYDTEVRLFDEPKSFTILCSATFNNYNWTAYTQGVFGISTGNYFRFGSIGSGKDYSNNEVFATANRYSALIINASNSGKNCISVFSRENSTKTRRFAVRYNHRTRRIEGITSSSGSAGSRWFIVPNEPVRNDTLKLLIGNASGTINEFKVYSGWLTDEEVGQFIANN